MLLFLCTYDKAESEMFNLVHMLLHKNKTQEWYVTGWMLQHFLIQHRRPIYLLWTKHCAASAVAMGQGQALAVSNQYP